MDNPVRTIYSHRGVAFLLLVALAIGFTLVSSASVQAAAAGCRTDPIIIFAGGTSLRIGVEIEMPVAEIDSIEYTVHLPADVQVIKIVYTGGELRDKELVTLVYDAEPDSYNVETIVRAKVSAETQVMMQLRSDRTVISGLTNETTSLEVNP